MTTLRDDCLSIFEDARVLIAQEGLRRHDVVMRVVTWLGQSVGEGAPTRVDTPLLIQGERVAVRRVQAKDVVASGGTLEDVVYKIGPFTPTFTGAGLPYPTGGLEPSAFNPADSSAKREVYYKISGPGHESGAWFEKISQDSDTSFSYCFNVKKVATSNP